MTTSETHDLLYGFKEIAEHLGLTERQALHLAEQDDSDFPVFKIGRRSCALRSKLDAWLAGKAAQAAGE